MSYEWDPGKARANAAKHGIRFADAATVLEDEQALTIQDPFSSEEPRWITIGMDLLGRVSFPRAGPRGASGNDMRKAMKREYDFRKGKRGAVVTPPKGKTRITIRIDDDILGWFRGVVERAGGGNYQSLINEALRRHVESSDKSFEKTLRRVIREELRRAS